MTKQELQAKQQEQDLTLTIDGVKIIKGYRVVVGCKKGSGFSIYVKGDRAEAKKVGENMRKDVKAIFNQKKVFVTLVPIKLKKCDISYCNELCEIEEKYCLGCSDLMLDAMCEAKSECERLA
jgi:hypothetical protein